MEKLNDVVGFGADGCATKVAKIIKRWEFECFCMLTILINVVGMVFQDPQIDPKKDAFQWMLLTLEEVCATVQTS